MPFLLPPIESWADWSASFNDALLWKPVIDAICDSEGVAYGVVEIPKSNTNAVFILDRRFVVKIYSPFWSEFDIEPPLLQALRRGGDVPVPDVVAAGRFQDRAAWDYLVIEYCEGQTLDAIRTDISREDVLSIAAQLGRIVSSLHETDLSLVGDIGAGESWEDLVERRRRDALAELVARGMIAPGVADSLAPILDAGVSGAKRMPRVAVHGDLESDHVLINNIGGEWKITRIIDFGDAKIGVGDYEWMPLWLGMFDRDIEAMRAFLGSYEPSLLTDEEWPGRVMAWTLLHDFGTDGVSEALGRSGARTPIETLDELESVVWPCLRNGMRWLRR